MAIQANINFLQDNAGTPGDALTNLTLNTGDTFFVEIQLGDFRDSASGLTGAQLDLIWTDTLLNALSFAVDTDFPFNTGADLATDGLANDVRGGSIPPANLGQAIGVNQFERFAVVQFQVKTVVFQVTFDSPVTDVDASDFTVNAEAIAAGATIGTITDDNGDTITSGTVFNVQVNGLGNFDGEVTLESLTGIPSSISPSSISNFNTNLTPASFTIGDVSASNFALADGVSPTVTANDDPFTTDETTPLNDTLLGNDLTGAGGEIFAVEGNAANVGQAVTLASGSTVIVNADGTFTFTPATGSAGSQDTFTYSLSVFGNSLQPVAATDNATVTITIAAAPTDIALTSTTIAENSAANSTIGTLSSTDADSNAFTYTLVSGDGSTDNDSFTLTGDQLSLNPSPDFETQSSYSIRVRSTDSTDLFFEKVFTIAVTDVDEFDVTAPVDTDTNADTIAEDAAVGDTVGITASATDDDGSNNTVTYSLTDDAGGLFAIDTNTGVVTVASTLDYETATTHNITVQAASSDGSTSNQTFTIAITDVNEAPSIALANTTATLTESTDTTNSIKVADIVVTDDALGTNTLSLSGDDAGLFEITGTELFLKAGTVLDFETNPQLDVTVEVDDSAIGNTPDNTAGLTIAITDVNEAPSIALANTTATLTESTDTTNSIKVADIVVTDDALGTNTLSLSGDDAGLFEITGTELFLKSGTTLDVANNPQLDVIIAVDDTTIGNTPDDTVNLSITVVTNQPPDVALENTTTTLSEDIDLTSRLKVADIVVTDDELGEETLTLSGDDSDLFEIDGTELFLKAGLVLDFETNPQLDVTVEVDDPTVGGNPDNIAALTINLTDVDEFDVTTPVDADANANTIAEDAAVGATVGITANATDDDGSNSTVTYSLTDDAGGLFEIDPDTGVVTVASALDYETATSHDITVEASSSDGSTSTQTFTIAVTDVDEFDVTAPVDTDTNADTIAEDAAVGDTVGITANATDNDGSNNTVTYSLTDDAGGLFAIDTNTGVVTVASALDYETATTHNITVEAASLDGSTSSQTFTIAVTDVDEFDVTTPVDTDTNADTIAEDITVGATVGITANATDDDGSNNTVTYSLTDAAGGLFAIDTNTGVVTVATALDYETATTHNITVEAASSDGSTSTQTFTIAVTDVDEFDVTTPVDTDTNADTIAEDVAVGATVGITASSTDDDGSNNTVTYSLTDDAGGLFAIDTNTGVVTVATALDYETATTHNITVEAASSDGSTSTQTFTIAVTDVDEFDVTTPVDADANANTIAENAANNSTVGITANATDDDGSNNTVTYSLTDDAGGRFAIDATTGVVTVADGSLLNFETATSHDITVQATSTDGSTSSQTFTIAVTDVASGLVSAISDTDSAANSIAENATNGSFVGITAFADDEDAGDTVTYSLTDDAGGLFAIDPNTGVVTVASALDYETATTHDITVKVDSSDGSSNSRTFTIAVTDVNEAPTVVDLIGLTPIAENTTTRTKVADIVIIDDALGTEIITLGGADADLFEVDGTELYLKAGATLDFETDSQLEISISVDDEMVGNTPDVTTPFTIAVTDVDEFDVTTPTDTDAADNTIAEDAAVGDTVGITASATDADGSNNTVTYSLTDDAGGLFAIDTNTGVVTVAAALDYETATTHDITVEAASSDGSTSTQTFTIAVTDVDEFDVTTPTDADAADNTIAEDAAVGDTVGITANATDDDGSNNTVTYSLTDDAGGLFAIDANTGVVTVAAALDYETATTHDITVEAASSDGSTSSQDFTIAVTDVNEAPTIVPQAFDVEFAENGTAVVLDIETADPEDDAITFALAGADADLFAISDQGEITFAQAPNFESPLDADGNNVYELQVEVSDGVNDPVIQAITITVTDANEAPIAQDDSASLDLQDAPNVVIRPLVNDSDPDGDSLTLASKTDGANGTVTIEGETLLYTPNSGFTGTDTFTYTITDGTNQTTGNVNVTVTGTTTSPELVLVGDNTNTPDTEVGNGLTFAPTGNGNLSLAADRASQSSRVQNVRNGTDAVFDNLIGLYEVLDATGGIDTDGDGVADLSPGENGYARAALTRGRENVNFSLRAGGSRTTAEQLGNDVFLVGGKLYAPFVIANGGSLGVDGFITAEDAETSVFNNPAVTANDPVTYFSFTDANPDGVAHLRSYGNGVFGFEDLPGNLPGVSDNDFNDAVFAFNFATIA